MTPVAAPFRYSATSTVIEIVVTPYPKYGTEVKDLLAGRFGERFRSEGGYDLYEIPVGKSDKRTAHVFKSDDGENVMVDELGNWSVRYKMVYAHHDLYLVKCYYGKGLQVSFRQMYALVSTVVEGMRER